MKEKTKNPPTTGEAAKEYACSRSTIKNWFDSGKLQNINPEAGQPRWVDTAALEALLKASPGVKSKFNTENAATGTSSDTTGKGHIADEPHAAQHPDVPAPEIKHQQAPLQALQKPGSSGKVHPQTRVENVPVRDTGSKNSNPRKKASRKRDRKREKQIPVASKSNRQASRGGSRPHPEHAWNLIRKLPDGEMIRLRNRIEAYLSSLI